jgi:drug/metabolite transporter (DMT)-like permease
MAAFASNSLLCRLALKHTTIDAATFTSIRILAGAVALWPIVKLRRHSTESGNWFSALALFAYAAAFSFAYVSLSAGTGALLLFGAVQATMILWGIYKGEKLHVRQLLGLLTAITGLVVLVLPGISAPPLLGSILMLGAGTAWGVYSLHGRGAKDPISATAGNFLRGVPFAIILSLILLHWTKIDSLGLIYALISGAITSGLGYVIWYAALRGLNSASAATVQLSVPVLAAVGGTKALAAVGAAGKSSDPALQDASTRLLGEWMTIDAAPVLLDLAKTSGNYQGRALRGYIRIARQFTMPDQQRAEMCKSAMEAARQPAEQKLVLEVLKRYPNLEMLKLAVKATQVPELKADAAEAALAISQKVGKTDEVRQLLSKAGLEK